MEELAFQDKIDAMNNVANLSSEVNIENTEQGLLVKFPDEVKGSKGQATLYRPSNAGKDVELPFQLTQNTVLPIPTSKLDKGLWVLKLNWEQDNKQYYLEQKLTL
jgi:nitrogen fixation protein FixH